MSKQRQFSDLKEGDLFIPLNAEEPVRVLRLTSDGDEWR